MLIKTIKAEVRKRRGRLARQAACIRCRKSIVEKRS